MTERRDCYDRKLTACGNENVSFALPSISSRDFGQVIVGIEDWFIASDASWFYVDFDRLDGFVLSYFWN